jgi:Tfp pilus assembly protein PilN
VIRINLLGVERQKAKKAFVFDINQRITLACSLIIVVAAVGIGWWWWSLNQEAARLDSEIASAQQAAARLQSVLKEVTQGEQRRAQLQQRVALIEQLRGGQSLPVQLLDHVSRSLPDMIWLTEMQQDQNALTIRGRSTTLIALSDFVGNLGNNPKLLTKPIEIVNSQVENASGSGAQAPAVEVIGFTVKAQITPQGEPSAEAARGRGGRAGAAAGGGRGRGTTPAQGPGR